MKRRDFICLSAISAGAALVMPAISVAETEKTVTPGADIYYTKEAQGRWAGKAATHLPSIEASKSGDDVIVKVLTAHEMNGYEHYIVKHVLLDKDYKFINEHMFNPTKDTSASSTFTLKNYSGTLYALSLCNKHDLWISSIDV